MLQRSTGLDPRTLDALAGLEVRCAAADGGRLKLEWGALRGRPPADTNDVLWWQDGELVGFAGRYAYGPNVPELTGMVDPAWRRRGIGSSLLDELLAVCADHGDARALLVTARSSEGARALATRRGGTFHHAEHALVLTSLTGTGAADPSISLRRATRADVASVEALLTSGFGREHAATDVDDLVATGLVAERDGVVVATLRVSSDADGSRGVYGFVVDPNLRGQGIGKDLLRRVCSEALAAGAPTVHLEVEVDNDRALGLYTSLGFERQTTEDYYELKVGARTADAHPGRPTTPS